MSEAAIIYAKILDQRLSSKAHVKQIGEEIQRLHGEGQSDLAKSLFALAMKGSALFPHQKKELSELVEELEL